MYYSKNTEEIITELKTNQEKGLTEENANELLKTNGKNILPIKKRKSIFNIIFEELSSPIEIILIITIIISFLIKETTDALVITFIVSVDIIMGTYQEYKALKSAEALSKLIKVKSKVIRNGKPKIIDSEDIVPGDILVLSSGDKIPADARIIECTNLQVDESTLTGESILQIKNSNILKDDTPLAERTNMLYASTNIMTGRALVVVVATGVNTEIGKIALSVSTAQDEKSPLTIRIEKFSKQISMIIIVISIISVVILYSKGYENKSIFLTVVALSVSAMPEGLPLALTMALTIASNRMGKKNVIVKKLNSVESLGSCTVIATDKTGTLTVNEQTAKIIVLNDGAKFEITGTGYTADGQIIPIEEGTHSSIKDKSSSYSNNDSIKEKDNLEKVHHLIELCSINNEATLKITDKETKYYGDSIDIAFLALKEKTHIEKTLKLKKIIPYESDKQYSAAFYEKNGKLYCTVKGSLEKVMSFSENVKLYEEQNTTLSKSGYRVIAVCDGEVKSTKEEDIKNLKFLGMVGFIDPVREEVKESINECHQAGIKIIMVTGDHPLTAYAIGKELNLVKNYHQVATGTDLEKAYNKGEKYFDNYLKDKLIFSRVTPTDKLNIVNSLKRTGEFVAVTGDGVNDAPAIKSANIGIAMGSGTDVAKEAASMIIIDDNFKSISEGIKEGRVAYANIRKIVLFLLSCGLAEVLFCLLSIIFGYELPLIAIQLLWINVVTDGLQDMALSFEKSNKNVMQEKPRPTSESIFNFNMMKEVLIYGISISLIVFLIWKNLIDQKTNLVLARSIIMMLMVFIQNIHVLNCRSESLSIFKTPLSTNPLITNVILGSILLQLIVTEIPFFANKLSIMTIPFNNIISIFLFSLIIIVIGEIYKIIANQINKINYLKKTK